MTEIDDGGPAYPFAKKMRSDDGRQWKVDVHKGMSLRDRFASDALKQWQVDDSDLRRLEKGEEPNYDLVAGFCYGMADAMLRARKKRGNKK